ncbi:MAG: hypothetical protein AAGH43_03485 [Pseudomonadota bacterium]
MIARLILAAVMAALLSQPAMARKGRPVPTDAVQGVMIEPTDDNRRVTGTLDGVTASLEGRPNSDDTTTPVFTVSDAGGAAIEFEGEPTFYGFLPVNLRIVQLDPSTPEPEVIASSYTGGAHCCERLQIAAISPDGSWNVTEMGFFDGGYSIGDEDGDGIGEIRVSDQSFLYTFDCYACSAPPPLFYRVVDGEPVDVSADPAFGPAFNAEFSRFGAPIEMVSEPGRLAGWVALNARIGLAEDALDTVVAVNGGEGFSFDVCSTGGAPFECAQENIRQVGFVEFLRNHLIEQGYMRRAGKG